MGGSTPTRKHDGHVTVTGQVDFSRILVPLVILTAATWLGGAGGSAVDGETHSFAHAAKWGTLGGLWLIVGGSWELARLAAFTIGSDASTAVVLTGPAFWLAFAAAGWLATFLMLSRPIDEGRTLGFGAARRLPRSAAGLDLFRRVHRGLCRHELAAVPRTCSCLTAIRRCTKSTCGICSHGKGFRSYLDQGLFLGEHIQVIHLFLLPLYVLWPSQMLLELCDSVILAAGCIPVFWMARRHAGALADVGIWLAAAYLLYFPLQYLDIGIELKTFRPNALAVPVLLFALDQLERRRYKTFCGLLLLTLSAQEDYAIVLAPLGVWIALRQWQPLDRVVLSKVNWRMAIFGTCVAALERCVFICRDAVCHSVVSQLGRNPLRAVFHQIRQRRCPKSPRICSPSRGSCSANWRRRRRSATCCKSCCRSDFCPSFHPAASRSAGRCW